jgi:hypothetical protein
MIGAWFALNVEYAQKSFWAHSMELLGDVSQMEAHFYSFGNSVNIDAS